MRENMVTVPRPRPGITAGWSATYPEWSAVDAPGPDGVSGYLRVVGDGQARIVALTVPLTAEDESLYASVRVRCSVETQGLMQLVSSTGSVALPANEWVELSAEHYVAGTLSTAAVYIGPWDGDAAVPLPEGETLDVTMAYVSTDPGEYFDGATPNDLDEVGRGWVYEWTGAAWESTSVERYGFAGLLSATWNPAWGAVHLVVDPGMWPEQTVQRIRIERTSASEGTVPVRGIENLPAPGGGYVGTDHEAPINETVQYTVYGYDASGQLVDSSTAVVKPEAGPCTLYVKAPGRPDMTMTPKFTGRDRLGSATRGGVYQIAGGGAVAQDGGADTTTATITVRTQTAGEARGLEGLLATARTILIQHGGEPEIPAGWWFVSSWEQANPAGKSFDVFSKRDYRLTLQATRRPAGVGVQFTGTTWGALIASHSTWQDVIDAYPTWLDVILGEG